MYQTLVGAWPIDVPRFRSYVLKAVHEAKTRTSWVNPHGRYDDAIAAFAEALLDRRRSREFLRDFMEFQTRVAHFAVFNSLAQVLVKTTAPGVPDFYQGTELWDGSLVDPDNRRPVDFASRRRLLDELIDEARSTQDLPALARDLVKTMEDGRVKLYVTRQALVFRQARAALFRDGAYIALEVDGRHPEHLCAFARTAPACPAVITVVPRLLARRGGDEAPLGLDFWADTGVRLPPGLAAGATFRNVFTGETLTAETGPAGARVAAAAVLANFPVGLLERAA
jgi:(1->4)-alpha-D-glucan 1-alpha-D-glucosylmutase